LLHSHDLAISTGKRNDLVSAGKDPSRAIIGWSAYPPALDGPGRFIPDRTVIIKTSRARGSYRIRTRRILKMLHLRITIFKIRLFKLGLLD
jgi:hypothetical protein